MTIDRDMIIWAVDNEITIADMGLIGFPARLRDILDSRGIFTLQQLLQYTADELKTMPGIGNGYTERIYCVIAKLAQLKELMHQETSTYGLQKRIRNGTG